MNGYSNYLESRILSADPVELVRIIYQAAVDSVKQAHRHLTEGRIKERSDAITRAVQLLGELSASLNHEVGGELSQNLARLYDYMQRRLLEANVQQSQEPLLEVVGLLSDLQDAWKAVGNLAELSPPPASANREANPAQAAGAPESAGLEHFDVATANPWAAGATADPIPDYATHSWSL